MIHRLRPRAIRWAAFAAAALVSLQAPPAHAVTPEEEARAEALFDEGRALMMEPGRLGEACQKLEESLRIYDRGDTLLNLAECHYRQGKTATAWTEFDRAIEHGAKVKFQEAMVVARARRDELAQQLSRLTVTVPPDVAELPGLEVRLNGAPLPKERWNAADIRDPGTFVVSATARGYVPFEARVALGVLRDVQQVEVKLEKEPPPKPAPPPPPPPPPPPDTSLPVWPFVVGGAGVVMLGVSAGFAIDRGSAGSELDEACGDERASCPESRRAELEDTRSREVASFGAFVGLGAGGILALGVAGVGLGLSLADGGGQADTALSIGPGSLGLRGRFQ